MSEQDTFSADYQAKRGTLRDERVQDFLKEFPAETTSILDSVKQPAVIPTPGRDVSRGTLDQKQQESKEAQKPIPRAIEAIKEGKVAKRSLFKDVPLGVIGGVRDFADEVIDTAESIGLWAGRFNTFLGNPSKRTFDDLANTPDPEKVDTFFDVVTLPDVPENQTITGNFVRGATQFLAGFVPVAGQFKAFSVAGKTQKILRSAAAAGITDFSVFDPHAERLSNFVEQFPQVRNPVTEFLQADPTDRDIEGRFKNVLEGFGLDVATAGVFTGVTKAIRLRRSIKSRRLAAIPEEKITKAGEVIQKQLDAKPKDVFGKQAGPKFEISDKPVVVKPEPKKQRLVKQVKEAAEVAEERIEEFSLTLESSTTNKTLKIPNLARLETTEDIDRVLKATAQTFKGEIDKVRRSIKTNEQTAELADEMGFTVSDLLSRQEGQAFNAEQALAARKLMVSSATKLKELAFKVKSPDASDIDRLQLRKALSLHAAVQQQVQGLTAEAGRTLQSFRIQAGSVREQITAIDEIFRTTGGRGSADDLAQAILDTENLRQLNHFTKKAHSASTFDMVYEYWMNSILSGPTTHMVNISSNMLTAMMQLPERATTALMGKALRTEGGVSFGEAIAQGQGILGGIQDGWRLFKQAFKDEGIADPLTKIEGADRRSITAGNLSQTFLGKTAIDPSLRLIGLKTLKEGGVAANLVDHMGTLVRVPGFRMLGAEDAFFKGLNYRMELNALSYRQASSEGLTGKALSTRMVEVLQDPPAALRQSAMEQAAINTFTNPNKLGQKFIAFRRKIPGARFIAPFINTPSNIMNFAFERSPFALLSSQIRNDIFEGGIKRDQALAKITTGSMAMLAASNLAMQGKITGGPPRDPNLRKIWFNENQPYSIKIENEDGTFRFLSYNRFEPLGMLMGFSADIANIVYAADEKDADELIGMAAMAFSRNVTSKTYMQNVSQFLDTVNNPERKAGDFVRNTISGFVPNLLSQVNRAFVDPILRDLDSATDALKRRIPGFSDDLPARRNLWGQTIEPRFSFEEGFSQKVWNLLSPAYRKDVAGDKTNEVILDNEISISMPSRSIRVPGLNNSVPLDAEEYNELVQRAGEPAKRELDKLVGSASFDKLSDGPDGQKAQVIKQIVNQFRSAARARIMSPREGLQSLIDKIDEQRDQELLDSI